MTTAERLASALESRYRIERELGAGGMATVYLAEDLKHDRKVAIKVLKPELAAVLGAERFVVEIKTTAALQHPHILPLFDSGTADGFLFYVMPYIQGETIRDKLNRETQFGIDEAVKIATEVADALDYAHRHGVIHRDIKPENILLHDGRPMVMDFGIALAVSAAAGGRMTETGLSLGTPHYMSPEQATADKAITGRSDVYSLASVLYEMLTGEPPHMGTSAQQIIMKIIAEPVRPATALRQSIPPNVSGALTKALQKLPADRFESAAKFADALRNPTFVGTALGNAMAAPAPDRASRVFSLPFVALSVIAAASLLAVAREWLRPRPVPRLARFELVTPDSAQPEGQYAGTLALARDGSQLAWVTGAPPRLYVRSMSEFRPTRLQGSEGWTCPLFSPDGSWLAVTQVAVGGRLAKISLSGGAPIVLADSASCSMAWTDRDSIVYVRGRTDVWQVSAQGGAARLVVRGDTVNRVRRFVIGDALPGGEAVLVSAASADGRDLELYVLTLADGALKKLGISGASARYAAGYVLFSRTDGNVFAAPFSVRARAITGPVVPIVQDAAAVNALGTSSFGVSDDGTLVYSSGAEPLRRLVRVDRTGRAMPVSADSSYFGWPELSPDGKRIALEIGTGRGSWDVWVQDLASQTLTRLTSGLTGVRPGGWTSDSRRVVYLAPQPGVLQTSRRVVAQAWDGSTPPEELIPTLPRQIDEVAIGPPHGYLAVTLDFVGGTAGDIWIAPLDSMKSIRAFVATQASEKQPRFSPDGKLLAYVSNETGRDEVYVRPVPGPGSRLQVSANGGTLPRWTSNGREIFYRGEHFMMVATLASEKELVVARRDSLFGNALPAGQSSPVAGGRYDVFPDGKSFLMIASGGRASIQLLVVQNWPALLRAREKR